MKRVLLLTLFCSLSLILAGQANPGPGIKGPHPPPPRPKEDMCKLAVDMVKQYGPESLSFSDKELVLSKKSCSPANAAAADQVWQSILAMEGGGESRLEIPVKVIKSGKRSLQVAVGEANQHYDRADVTVAMEKPLTKPPAAGTMIKVTGVISSYKPQPFMFQMTRGRIAEK